MILFLTSALAGLSRTQNVAVGVDADLQLEITDGRPRLAVVNQGSTPLVVDWSRSWVTPIGGAMSELVPGGADRPTADVLVAPTEVAAGERITVQPVPRAWLADGDANDALQWATWSDPGTVTIELVVMSDAGEGTLKATWEQRTTGAPAASAAPLAIPADPDAPPPSTATGPTVAPRPLPDPGLRERRLEWDRRFHAYRRQERTARVLWVTGGTLGILAGAFAGLSAAQIPNAPEDPIDPEASSRQDLIDASRTYAILGGAGLLVAGPTFAWDFSTRKKRKKMGPRP